jgi:hypothetical protein
MKSEVLYNVLFKSAHDSMEEVMADVTDKIANWLPEKIVATIGAQYVHAVTSEDAIVNAILKGGAPLMATKFAGKIGAASAPELFSWGEWGRAVKVDVSAAKAYAQAVYAATAEYVGNLNAKALGEILDLSHMNLGHMPRAAVLSIALTQPFVHSGEISALKGLQGLKGYAM